MAGNNRATQTKQQRERARKENTDLKSEKRALRKEKRRERDENGQNASGVDPDLVGIVPGPQPIDRD